MWATGIEGSDPTIAVPDGRGGVRTRRVDPYAAGGFYDRWRDDFALVRHDLGLRCLRYGPAYHATHVGPGRYDWSFADETFAELRRLGVEPVVDLCHFGVPDWAGDFQNPDWPALFAGYAGAFAARFPWVRLYTPVNEIMIAATFSARYGWWNERLSSDRAFVVALKHLCRANVLAMDAVAAVRPDAVFVQSETSEHHVPIRASCLDHTHFLNERRFLAFDLTYGHDVDAPVYAYLLDNGMARDEYEWFGRHARRHARRPRCVMGNDYYLTNEHFVHEDGGLSGSGEMFGYAYITKQYVDRYHLPVFHTETNVPDADLAPAWLRRQAMNVYQLKREGVPVVGFTWYPLTDLVDWDTQLREANGTVVPCGLYDLGRRPRPVAAAYREVIAEWGDYFDAESVGPLAAGA